MILSTFINFGKRFLGYGRRKPSESGAGDDKKIIGRRVGTIVEIVIGLFLSIWTSIGSRWVYRFYSQYNRNMCNQVRDSPVCCHPVPYFLAFVSIILIYTVILLLFLCGIFSCLCVTYFAKKRKSRAPE